MRGPSMLYLISLLLSLIVVGSCMTDLDYRLSKTKDSDSAITSEESFHGDVSARLSVKNAGNYARIMIYMDEPIPIEELDSLSMQVDPISGDGDAQIEIFLDGDGDDSYNSGDSNDVRLRTIKKSWSETGIQPGEWSELDGTDLSYEKYGDDSFGTKSFEDCRKALSGKTAVRMYITVYKDSAVNTTTAYIDYLKIGDQIISFEPLERELAKSAPKSASPGSEMTYTITYGNNFLEPLNLQIRENYDPRTLFVSADPVPDEGTNNIWTIRDLPPGEHGQIRVLVRTGKISCKADIKGTVSGIGYASSNGRLSTDLIGFTVTNSVDIVSSKFNITASASTLIRSIEGSTIAFREHGSGYYSSEEQLSYSATRVYAFRDINASRSYYETNTSPSLLSGLFNRSWYASVLCEDKAKDMMMSEAYAEGMYLDLDSQAYLSKKSSYFDATSSFSGFSKHTLRLENNVYVERFVGNFTTTNNARAKSDTTSESSDDDEWLK